MWGPGGLDVAGPQEGKWRVADGKITLTHKGQTFECIVTWSSADQWVVESADGKIHAIYDRNTEPADELGELGGRRKSEPGGDGN